MHGKIYKNSYKNNEFKMLAPVWNEKFKLPEGSFCISDNQDYFEFIIKKHEALCDNLPIQQFFLI